MGVAKALLEDLQIQMHLNPQDHDILQAETEAAKTVRDLTKALHSFLSQKANVTWLKDGDENTRFFHTHIRAKQIRNSILQLRDMNGILHTGYQEIENAFLIYYQSLLGTSKSTDGVNLPIVRQGSLITEDHSTILLAPVTTQEIKKCFFEIPANKSPGPDGFSSQFYKDSWETVGDDVCKAVQDFFSTG
ncbi:hypothetical protein vseg_016026 [Gypsophila vaccaria]